LALVLTIDQALLKAVENHKAGNLQEAEKLYRAIIQVQPQHPDANHNLGVLAVAVRKPNIALPLFKVALEANPKVDQFWLSYVDALIRTNKTQEARNVLQHAKKIGSSQNTIIKIEEMLDKILPEMNKENKSIKDEASSLSPLKRKLLKKKDKKKANKQSNIAINTLEISGPFQEEINKLLYYFNTGNFINAEKMARSHTEKFPNHPFGWKALGAILSQTGKNQEALLTNLKATKFSPQDPEVHSNLGKTLNDLGRLDEAEASNRQAIKLKPEYA